MAGKRTQNPRVCHGHTRPIVELSYRCGPSLGEPLDLITRARSQYECRSPALVAGLCGSRGEMRTLCVQRCYPRRLFSHQREQGWPAHAARGPERRLGRHLPGPQGARPVRDPARCRGLSLQVAPVEPVNTSQPRWCCAGLVNPLADVQAALSGARGVLTFVV